MQTNKYWYFFLHTVIIVALLALPYYLFYPNYFIGGDDSRIFTILPRLFLEQIAPYSWFHLSSFGTNNPGQFFIPLTAVMYIVQLLIHSQIIVSYLFFSLPFILGLIYFELLATYILPHHSKPEAFIGALLYIASPMMIVMQWSIFLTSVWLIGLFPALAYYYLRFVNEKKIKYLYIASILSLVLSVALSAIPWLLGYIIPACFGLFVLGIVKLPIIYTRSFWRRTAVFIICIAITQSFWLFPFVQATFSPSPNSIGTALVSTDTKETFVTTVNATAVGTIIYPMLNLFHHQIAQNFNWPQLPIFKNQYDRLSWFNLLLPIVFLLGLYHSKRNLSYSQRTLFLALATTYALSLYFFTVNIGNLKNVFLYLGDIPGWVMFRNSFDKFAPGYVFYMSILFAYCLTIIKRGLVRYRILLVLVVLMIIVNGLPIAKLINHPLWTTNNIQTTTTISTEYTTFMETIRTAVSPTTNILSIPLNNAGYGIIATSGSDYTYVGRSLVEIFANRYDLSGEFSFPHAYKTMIRKALLHRDSKALITLLQQLNIGYIFTTENIPIEIQKSYLFDQKILAILQDPTFLKEIKGEFVAQSTHGNFSLYRLKGTASDSLVNVPSTVYFSSAPDSMLLSDTTSVIISSDNPPKTDKVGQLYFPRRNQPLQLAPGEYTLQQGENISYAIDGQPYQNSLSFTLEHSATFELQPPELPVTLPPVQEWSKGDCAATDSTQKVSFSSTTNNGLRLAATDNHNACIYTTIPVNPGTTYTVTFEAYSQYTNTIATFIDFNDSDESIHTTMPIQKKTWSTVSLNIQVPHNKQSVQLYLYSGLPQSQSSETEYKNVQIVEYPSIYDTVALYRQAKQNFSLPPDTKATIEKISPIAYKVHLDRVPSEFLLQFKEAFNSGWHIYPQATYAWYTPLISRASKSSHYQANGSTNAWWIRQEELCNTANCTDFLIVFTPQRWFYIGSAVTLVFLIIVTITTMYITYRNKYVSTIL